MAKFVSIRVAYTADVVYRKTVQNGWKFKEIVKNTNHGNHLRVDKMKVVSQLLIEVLFVKGISTEFPSIWMLNIVIVLLMESTGFNHYLVSRGLSTYINNNIVIMV